MKFGNLGVFWKNKNLIKQLVIRDVLSRYKGSYLGVLWSFVIPILMLIVYTFVFSVVFKAKWNAESQDKLQFALIIFTGMTVFNLFSEVVNRAPGLILNNTNYVKKVVFPLEILNVVTVISSCVQTLISLLILVIGLFVFDGGIHWTIISLPIVMLPIIFLSLGLSWFLSSLGVYFRDVNHIVGVAVGAAMFLTPIFYSVTSVPNNLIFIYNLNPLSYVVEDMRKIMIWGQWPSWNLLLIGTLISIVICFLGYIWFVKTRKGFADVI